MHVCVSVHAHVCVCRVCMRVHLCVRVCVRACGAGAHGRAASTEPGAAPHAAAGRRQRLSRRFSEEPTRHGSRRTVQAARRLPSWVACTRHPRRRCDCGRTHALALIRDASPPVPTRGGSGNHPQSPSGAAGTFSASTCGSWLCFAVTM